MKLGRTRYCIRKACSQPAGIASSGGVHSDQRAASSRSAHHSMASSTLALPTKNIIGAGPAPSRRGEAPGRGAEGRGVTVRDMGVSVREGVGRP